MAAILATVPKVVVPIKSIRLDSEIKALVRFAKLVFYFILFYSFYYYCCCCCFCYLIYCFGDYYCFFFFLFLFFVFVSNPSLFSFLQQKRV